MTDHLNPPDPLPHDTPGRTGKGPWSVLILDRNPDDPMWALAFIAIPGDIRPAALDPLGRYTDWQAVTEWVARTYAGQQVALVPMHDPLVWSVDDGNGHGPLSATGEAPLPEGNTT